jgi:hypothetical protein
MRMRKTIRRSAVAVLAALNVSVAAAEEAAKAPPPEAKEEAKKEPEKKEPSAKPNALDAFAEALKRSDPEAHKRFVELRDARAKDLAELSRLQQEIDRASGDQLANLHQQFKEVRKKYARSYIAYLDFLDDLDRKGIERHQAAIDRLKGVMDKRKKAREKLEAVLKE